MHAGVSRDQPFAQQVLKESFYRRGKPRGGAWACVNRFDAMAEEGLQVLGPQCQQRASVFFAYPVVQLRDIASVAFNRVARQPIG